MNAEKLNPALVLLLCGLTAISVVALAACKSTASTGPPGVIIGDPSFSKDIEGIFSNNCTAATCHGAAKQAELVLFRGQVYGNIVNISSGEVPTLLRVLPFDAEDSEVILKLEGSQTAGARMPATGTPLNASDIQNIKNWINKGAKDN